MKFIIGRANQKPIKVDAMVLADTRALINASSGLGKSWLLRLVAEHVAAVVQTIILDPEGEFSTLREQRDLLIVSDQGDLRADIGSARLLARKLAETGISAVIDLYELPGPGDPWVKRRMFVAEFIGELMNLPKKLWLPRLVMVDEAHQFAQEVPTNDIYTLNGERVKPSILARSAVRSMMSAGRKRGIGGILATQRISKIDKDSIADVRNWFVGGATLDIDQQRAGDILGMSKAQAVALRDLEPGTFFAFGPAIECSGIVQFKSDPVQTTHPKAGRRTAIVVPKASTQIEQIAKMFGDLPAIAQEEAQTLESLQHEVGELRRQLRASQAAASQAAPKIEQVQVKVPLITDQQIEGLQVVSDHLKVIGVDFSEAVRMLNDAAGTVARDLAARATELMQQPVRAERIARLVHETTDQGYTIETTSRGGITNKALEAITIEKITGPMQRILDALARFVLIGNNAPKQVAVAFLAGYVPTGGAFTNPRGALNSAGLVEYLPEQRIRLTDYGRQLAKHPGNVLTVQELQQSALSRLPGPHQKIMRVLLEKYPKPITKESCAALAGYAMAGAFTNPLGRLRTWGLVDYPQPGFVVAEPWLFLE